MLQAISVNTYYTRAVKAGFRCLPDCEAVLQVFEGKRTNGGAGDAGCEVALTREQASILRY